MKSFILPLLMVCIAMSTQAQITINPSDITFDTTGHTFFYKDIDVSSVSVPQGGEDVVWDYTNIQFTPDSYSLTYESTSNPDYPGANVRRATSLNYLGLTFPSYRYNRFDETGFRVIGYEDLDLSFPLGNVTANPADTLFILGGPRVESTSQLFFNLPMAYGDSLALNTESNINMIANIPTFGLNNFPVRQNIIHTGDINTIGWGKLAITNPTTQNVDTFEVLLQKRVSNRIDNYYDAANNPLPATLLTPLGLSQNTITVSTYYTFYVKGVNNFALSITTFDGVLYSSDLNEELFTLGTPVSTTPKNIPTVAHNVYPNPIQNNQFQLELELDKNNGENWQLDIYNLVGQSIHNELITNNISTIQLNDNLSSGTYFYTIRNEAGQTIANGKLMK